MTLDETTEIIAFGMTEGVGPSTARKLLQQFGSVHDVLSASGVRLRQLGFSEKLINGLKDKTVRALARKEAEHLLNAGGRAVVIGQPGYPSRLSGCPDAPVVLFIKGLPDLDAPRMVSIVGTRRATHYGQEVCRALVQELAIYKVSIVSGLAFGIDIVAHRAALDQGLPTVACLAHGLDRIYPKEHYRDALAMLDAGGWVSEFAHGTAPSREHFPSRNRVIAGLSDCTVVIESDRKGGSIITARLAASYHREVFAIPGDIRNTLSNGCHMLIRRLEAQLITHGSQIARELGWEREMEQLQLRMPIGLEPDQALVAEVLQQRGPTHLDELGFYCAELGSRLSFTLLQMELLGIVKHLPGQRYSLS
ncbi:MAG: DNA-protecting protein DprA [Bacteroidota bacterium]|jgi:DNA processing protein